MKLFLVVFTILFFSSSIWISQSFADQLTPWNIQYGIEQSEIVAIATIESVDQVYMDWDWNFFHPLDPRPYSLGQEKIIVDAITLSMDDYLLDKTEKLLPSVLVYDYKIGNSFNNRHSVGDHALFYIYDEDGKLSTHGYTHKFNFLNETHVQSKRFDTANIAPKKFEYHQIAINNFIEGLWEKYPEPVTDEWCGDGGKLVSIPVRIEGGTLHGICFNYPNYQLWFYVDMKNDGVVHVSLPRISYDLTNEKCMDEEIRVWSRGLPEYSEIKNEKFRILSIPLKKGSDFLSIGRIELKQFDGGLTACQIKIQEKYSPMEQKRYFLDSESNLCVEGRKLIFKASDSFPACVKPLTAEKLIERGWAKNEP